MRRLAIVKLLSIFAVATIAILFCTLPSDPSEDPRNADVSITFTDANPSVESGNTRRIMLDVEYPQHFETIRLRSSCSSFDTTVEVQSTENGDTLYFDPLFNTEGSCTVFVSATYRDRSLKDKTGLVLLHVDETRQSLEFVKIPDAIITHAGRIDTLLFVTSMQATFTVESTPRLDSSQLHLLSAVPSDTARIVFDPDTADSFTVNVHATAIAQGETLHDSTTVGAKVYRSFAFSTIDAPQTVIIGTADTLFFVADNNRPDALSIELTNEAALDQATMKVLESVPESLLVVVTPSTEGHFELVIRTSNGVVSDTIRHLVTFTGRDTAIWDRSLASVSSTEGSLFTVDLKQYLIRPVSRGFIFSTTIGSITTDTIWQWTPPWGCDSVYNATITANKGGGDQIVQLAISVIPGDNGAPKIRLVDPAFADNAIGSSQITVETIVTDTGAGVSKVTFTTGSKTVDGILRDDSVFSGTITGLVAGERTEVTISAFDKSMKKNHSEKKLYLTLDATLKDELGPIFIRISGPASGDIVKDSIVTITDSIIDPSGVDSVYWTRNGTWAGMLVLVSPSAYSLKDTLKKNQSDTIVIYAQDKSVSRNKNSTTIIVNFNPPPIIIQSPQSITKCVGDSVILSVNASGTLPLSYQWKKGNVIIGTIQSFYKIIALTNADSGSYSCVVSNSTGAETTSSTAVLTIHLPPSITTQPASITKCAGGEATFSIVATGTPPLVYQWQKDGSDIFRANEVTYTISNVTSQNAGTYSCRVLNGCNSSVTSTAVALIVNTNPTITTQPVSITKCVGQSATFTITASGSSSFTYQWKKGGTDIPGATSATYSIASAITSHAGDYTCFVNNNCGDGVYSNAATLTMNIQPSIVSQTTGTITRWAADTVTFNVAAMGSDTLNYQWEKNGTNITGATSATYSIPNVNYIRDNGARFSCIVYNGCGNGVISSPVTLTVKAVKAVATGYYHSLFLMADGTLWACGQNDSGQLGDGTTIMRNAPKLIMSDVSSINAGCYHNLVVKTNGTLWAFGNNSSGQLGDNSFNVRTTPVHITSAVSSAVAGCYHSLILKTDNTLWGCGAGSMLGLGDTMNRRSPIYIKSSVSAIAAGWYNSYIVKTDGTLWSTGDNWWGQLGYDTNIVKRTEPIYSPVDTFIFVMPNVSSVAAGISHSFYLKNNGTLWGCGSNVYGALGNNCNFFPIQILTGVSKIATQNNHSYILSTDGTLFGTGENSYGQLGDGTVEERKFPIQVSPGVATMATGYSHSLIVKTDGTVWSCGDNSYGQLGDGTTSGTHTPMQIKW